MLTTTPGGYNFGKSWAEPLAGKGPAAASGRRVLQEMLKADHFLFTFGE